jgi:hypothetical protein
MFHDPLFETEFRRLTLVGAKQAQNWNLASITLQTHPFGQPFELAGPIQLAGMVITRLLSED